VVPRIADMGADPFGLLLTQRTVVLGGEVNDFSADAVISQLLLLDAQDPREDIKLFINSPGGSVTAGMGVYDAIQLCRADVQVRRRPALLSTGLAPRLRPARQRSQLEAALGVARHRSARHGMRLGNAHKITPPAHARDSAHTALTPRRPLARARMSSPHKILCAQEKFQHLDVVCRVQTFCFGLAASMGAFLLGSGRKGKRYSMPNARIMIHQPLGGASGQAIDVEIQVRRHFTSSKELKEINPVPGAVP
jgi:ATP-dependent protease ClpP protease subunit